MLGIHSLVRRTGLAVIVISQCALPAGAVAAGHAAQNNFEADKGAIEPIQAPVAGVPAALPANSPEQIRKAQTELQRLRLP